MRSIEDRLDAYAESELNDPHGRNLLATLLHEASSTIRSLRSQCDFAHDEWDKANARIAELEARAEDYSALFENWAAAEAELRELVASMPPAPKTYEVLADLHEEASGHKCSYGCDSPYAVNCNCAGKCKHHPTVAERKLIRRATP